MKLADYQRELLRLSFLREAPEASFTALGDAPRFHLYRQMIRTRLSGMAKQAFKVSLELVGSRRFDASFERFLAAQPPTRAFIRDAIADFGVFARTDRELLDAGPAWLVDLVRFEEAKWRVAYRRAQWEPEGLVAFDFSAAPWLNPTLVLLELDHPVQSLVEAYEKEPNASLPEPPASASRVFVYRPPRGDDIRWYAADPLTFGILSAADPSRAEPSATANAEPGATSLAELVRSTADRLGKPLDEALLEELTNGVTLALQRGVVLGSR
jgi:hypothetical protein